MFTPDQHFSPRPPDFTEGGPDFTDTLHLWLPDGIRSGVALHTRRSDGRHTPSTVPGISPALEANEYARVLSVLTTALPELYSYLGVSAVQTDGEEGMRQSVIHFCHPETLRRKLGALELADDVAPPGFTLAPEGRYGAKQALKRLADADEFVMADSGVYGAHDILTHGVTAQMLVAPSVRAVMRADTRKALAKGGKAIGDHMEAVDLNMSIVGYGAMLVALCQEETAITGRPELSDSPPSNTTSASWRRLIERASDSPTPAEQDILAADTRRYLTTLRKTAARMLAA